MKKNWFIKIVLFAGFIMMSQVSMAQWDDDGDDGWGDEEDDTEESSDTEASDSLFGDDDSGEYMEGWGDDASETNDDLSAKPYKLIRPVYERIQMPFDSIRELIYYTEVIEAEDCDECMADSLYIRSRKFLTSLYGKKALKKFISEDQAMQKLVLTVSNPMYVRKNKFAKAQNGTYEYKLILRFQDYRYKYDVSNFVHVTPPFGAQKENQRTYMEYYVKSEQDIENNDKILRNVDTDMKEFVAELKKALMDPPFLGEDLDNDW